MVTLLAAQPVTGAIRSAEYANAHSMANDELTNLAQVRGAPKEHAEKRERLDVHGHPPGDQDLYIDRSELGHYAAS